MRIARQAGQGRTAQEHLLGLRGDQEAFASSTQPPPAGGRAGWGPPAMTRSVFASRCLRALCPWWDHLVSAHLLRGREAGRPGEATAACMPSLLLCLPPSCQLVHPSPSTHQFVHSRPHVRGWGHSGYHLCPWVLGRPTGAKQIQGQSEAVFGGHGAVGAHYSGGYSGFLGSPSSFDLPWCDWVQPPGALVSVAGRTGPSEHGLTGKRGETRHRHLAYVVSALLSLCKCRFV